MNSACYFLPVALILMVSPGSITAVSTRRCHSIYKSFARCLMALGDSMTDNTGKGEDTHEIHSICSGSHLHYVRGCCDSGSWVPRPEDSLVSSCVPWIRVAAVVARHHAAAVALGSLKIVFSHLGPPCSATYVFT
nr:uncharacterized protein LOC133612454 isoform X4 [Nerophis lumbriciformis]